MRKVAIAATLAALSMGAIQTASAEGFYAGAGVGSAQVKAGTFKDDDIGFKLYGGYSINQNVAAEIEYLDGGVAKDNGFSVGSHAFAASVLGVLPLSPQFSLFGRLGLASWEYTKDSSDDGTDLIYGVGGDLEVAPQVKVRAEWEAIDVDHGTYNVFGVSAIFKF